MKNTPIGTSHLKQLKTIHTFSKLALTSAISAALFATQASAATYGARIIGGADATPNTYPWMVSVQNKAEGEHFCGASLIAEKYVLTAAHCIESERADAIQVVISEFDLQQSSEQEEKLAVKNIYMHQQYGDDNDIAILELASATNKTPVKLADSSLLESLAAGSPFTVMGWGNLLADGEQFPNTLQEVQVPLVAYESCKSSYANVGMEITGNMLCAGLSEGGKDSCQGDSGGPLVYQKDSEWFQTGVVSFGEGCAQANYPGVYTKVSNYSEWIAQVKAGEVPVHQPTNEGGSDDDGMDDDDWGNDDLENQEWPEFEEQNQAFGLPPYVGFLAPGVNETTEEVIVMYNEDDSAVTIQGISLGNEQVFSVIENGCDAVTLNKDDACEIKLGFNADNTQEHETTLLIGTSDESNAEIELELFGIVMSELDIADGYGDGFEDGYDGDLGDDSGEGWGDDFEGDMDGGFDGDQDDEFGEDQYPGDEAYAGADNLVDGEWFFEGTPWSSDQEAGFELACHTVNENDDSILMTEIEGPGTLTFDMSLSDDNAQNALVFMVDGKVVKTVSGQRSNNSHTTDLSEGEHQVSWVYQKAVENTAAATASISNMHFEAEGDNDMPEDGNEAGGNEGNLDKPVGELTLSEIKDELGGAGSSDGLLLGLLALFGFGLRKRQK